MIIKLNIKSVHKISVQPPRIKICTSPYPTPSSSTHVPNNNNTHSENNYHTFFFYNSSINDSSFTHIHQKQRHNSTYRQSCYEYKIIHLLYNNVKTLYEICSKHSRDTVLLMYICTKGTNRCNRNVYILEDDR